MSSLKEFEFFLTPFTKIINYWGKRPSHVLKNNLIKSNLFYAFNTLVPDPQPTTESVDANNSVANNDSVSMETSTITYDAEEDEEAENQQPIRKNETTKPPAVAKRRRGIQIASDSEEVDDGDNLQIDESYKSPLKERRNQNNSLPGDDDDNEPLGNNKHRTLTGTKRRSAMLDSDDDSDDGEEKENQPKKARVEEAKENDDKVGEISLFDRILYNYSNVAVGC